MENAVVEYRLNVSRVNIAENENNFLFRFIKHFFIRRMLTEVRFFLLFEYRARRNVKSVNIDFDFLAMGKQKQLRSPYC